MMDELLILVIAAFPFGVSAVVCLFWNWPAGIGFRDGRDWQVARPQPALQLVGTGAFLLVAALCGAMIVQARSPGDWVLVAVMSPLLLFPIAAVMEGTWRRRIRWNDEGIEDSRIFGERSFVAWSDITDGGVRVMGASLFWTSDRGTRRMHLALRPSRELYRAMKERLGTRFNDRGDAYRFLGLSE